MASAVLVGKESTHGTAATTFVSVPAAFDAKLIQANKVLEEDRQGQDRHFAVQKGQAHEEFSIGDSAVYHDSIGLWLCSALGAPTKTVVNGETAVYDNVFKMADDPVSLTLKWQQPRRYTQAFQSVYAVIDSFDIKFEAEGDLTYSGSGIAMPESETTQLTFTWSGSKPMPAWRGQVTLGGSANADLVSGSISIARNRKPFYTINNNQAPSKIAIGARTVDFELTLDFVSKAEYDQFKAAAIRSLQIEWTDTDTVIGTAANPKFTVKLGSIAYEAAEIDTGGDLPLIKLSGKALYDSTDASLIVVTVRSTKDYTA